VRVPADEDHLVTPGQQPAYQAAEASGPEDDDIHTPAFGRSE